MRTEDKTSLHKKQKVLLIFCFCYLVRNGVSYGLVLMKEARDNNLFLFKKEHLFLHNLFFEKIISEFALEKIDADIVAVLHILPDALPFSRALSQIANVKTIVAKPKSVNHFVLDYLRESGHKIVFKDGLGKEIEKLEKETVFLDIGGYFSSYLSLLKTKNNFAGIVEDTENGLQKYKKAGVDFPFLSVARSPLKANEDFLVGGAIVYSVERILREQNIIINGLESGVIGFGKIGSSVAYHLSKKQSAVSVFDKNNVLLTHAVSRGFGIRTKKHILSKSDIVCLATGNRSLVSDDFQYVKNGAFLFSVTSSDDEFDKGWLKNNYKKTIIIPYIAKYQRGSQYFYLLNDGEAINFVHGTTVGEYILLVHAELLVSAYALLATKAKKGFKFDNNFRDKIAQIWLDIFGFKRRKVSHRLSDDIVLTLKKYQEAFPEENISPLLEYAKKNPACAFRSNKEGHVTASGFVVRGNEVLLIFHNKLQRYLQPGGHMEEKDNTVFDAAKREVEEETGLSVLPHKDFGRIPVHIDVQKIPENKKRGEPAHFHYDCMFVFELKGVKNGINLQSEEVSDFTWVSMDYDFQDEGIKNAIKKIKGRIG